jgi:hypothetical protein
MSFHKRYIDKREILMIVIGSPLAGLPVTVGH